MVVRLLTIGGVVFLAEFAVMAILPLFNLDGLLESAVDSLLLAILSLPALYLLGYSPSFTVGSVDFRGVNSLEKKTTLLLLIQLVVIIGTIITFALLVSRNTTGVSAIDKVGRLRMLSQRYVHESLAAAQGAGQNEDKHDGHRPRMSETVESFDKILTGLINGDGAVQLPARPSENIARQLRQVSRFWEKLRTTVEQTPKRTLEGDRRRYNDELNLAVARVVKQVDFAIQLLEGHYSEQARFVQALLGFTITIAVINATLLAITFFQMIRQHKRLNRELQEKQGTLEAIMEYAPEGLITIDGQGTIQSFNKAAEAMFGYTANEIKGMNVKVLMPSPHREKHDDHIQQYLTTGVKKAIGIRRELIGRRKDGSLFQVELSINEVCVDGNQSFTGFVRDISQRKRAEQELKANADQQEALAQLSHIALEHCDVAELFSMTIELMTKTLDVEYGMLWVVQPGGESLQLKAGVGWKEDLVDHTTVEAGSGDLPNYTLLVQEPVIIEDLGNETRFDGPSFLADHDVISGLSVPIRCSSHAYGVLGVHTNRKRTFSREEIWFLQSIATTLGAALERWKTDELLRQNEARLRRLFESNIIGIMEASTHGVVTYANDLLLQMLGYKRHELPFRWDTITPAEYHDSDLTAIRMVERVGVAGPWEKEYIRKDGTRVPVLIGVAELEKGSGHCICFVLDITQRKELETKLGHAQKLESIGQLAAGIAHEINTPTQFVGDNTRFLKDSFDDLSKLLHQFISALDISSGERTWQERNAELKAAVEEVDLEYLLEEIPKAIEQSIEGIERVTTIVRSMKEFSHMGGKEKELVDLNKAIKTTITVARNEWKYVSDVETDLDSSLPLISCHSGDINQVVLNMIVNAAHAIADVVGDGSGGKGTIKISTALQDGWAEIRISDTGCGIPEEIRSRIFDPFFTTKDVGRGTGQGLAISRSVIVKKHGGSIDVESQVGKGTTFIIRLPIEDLADGDQADRNSVMSPVPISAMEA